MLTKYVDVFSHSSSPSQPEISMKFIAALTITSLCLFTACERGPVEVSSPGPVSGSPAGILTLADAETVMSGLNNPRGLAIGPDGALFVAEAGRGGAGPCFTSTQVVCYGPTGAVGRLLNGVQDTVVTGLPSYANSAGRAEGPNAIAFLGMGGAYVTIGLESHPDIRTQAPEFAGFASLVHVSAAAFVRGTAAPRSQQWDFVADLGAYETTANPDCGRIDSNPFAVLATPRGLVIADAGGNSLIGRDAAGDLSTFTAFSSRYTTAQHPACPEIPSGSLPTETVPTSVVIGPDGAYYVGQLGGFPLVVGAAKIFRVVPGSAPTVAYTGFTFVISLAFDIEGNLYVLQHTNGPSGGAPGSLIRVAPDGTRTTVIDGLLRPTSIAIGSDGAIYISHRGTSVGTGEVLRIRP